jgi:hypothetical protein
VANYFVEAKPWSFQKSATGLRLMVFNVLPAWAVTLLGVFVHGNPSRIPGFFPSGPQMLGVEPRMMEERTSICLSNREPRSRFRGARRPIYLAPREGGRGYFAFSPAFFTGAATSEKQKSPESFHELTPPKRLPAQLSFHYFA